MIRDDLPEDLSHPGGRRADVIAGIVIGAILFAVTAGILVYAIITL